MALTDFIKQELNRPDLTPKLWTAWREGYGFADFKADFIAGLTVAIVALPLSMAIAIASNASPAVGLKTAFVAGFWISVLGGSRHQIGGPTAAFAIVVANIIGQFGMDGLILATLMAGLILMAAAIFRLGAFLKYVPHPVVIGFTSGIAVTIFITQIGAFFGLKIAGNPTEVIERLHAYWAALASISAPTVAVSLFSLFIIVVFRRLRPHWPYFLIAVVATSIAALLLHLPIETVGHKFGEVKTTIPDILFPTITLARLQALLPSALTIAFLAGIESLLSAVVADGMTGNRHRSNAELLSQGFANIMSAITGGLPATGAIARTATNIRAGAKTPMAGILHATLLLLMLLVAGKLTAYIPLATLAAILMVVAWNMAEIDRVIRLFRFSATSDRLILVVTFALTVFADLTVAVEVGIVLSAIMFMHHMSEAAEIEETTSDNLGNLRESLPKGVEAFQIRGPLFFGAAGTFVDAIERIDTPPTHFILNMEEVPFIDAAGIAALLDVVGRLRKSKTTLIITGLRPNARKQLAKVRATTSQLSGVRYATSDAGALDLL
ncbi:MAG: high affinity sulfate transporter sulfate permease family protein [Hyphomonadaceae bacterium]|nr:MAG: high affinity sulfate transporter sulfate permease family protein [Hyphomonadaceae bacterium]